MRIRCMFNDHQLMLNGKCYYCGEETQGWGPIEKPSEHLRRLNAEREREQQHRHNALLGTVLTRND